MHGIEIRDGVNDCWWNVDGRCTCARLTRPRITYLNGRDYTSRVRCTLTQLGVHVCTGYRPEGQHDRPAPEAPAVCPMCRSADMVKHRCEACGIEF